jgi:hypothetical protein
VNRSKILRSLYVILLGNPALDEKQDAPMKTRFKMWYRLVGAAVEHAAQCAAWLDPDRDHMPDQALDFGSLFLDRRPTTRTPPASPKRSIPWTRPWPTPTPRWAARSNRSKPPTWPRQTLPH